MEDIKNSNSGGMWFNTNVATAKPSQLTTGILEEHFGQINWLYVYIIFSLFIEAMEQLLNIRQLRRYHRKTRPPTVECLVSEEGFLKSNNYNSDKMMFSIFTDLISCIISTTMLLTYMGPIFWRLSGTLLHTNNEYIQSLGYLGLNMLVSHITSIPFSLFFDFIIEERHGFNKKTLKLFIRDELLSVLLCIFIGAPLVCMTIYLVKWGGETFYLYLWGFAVFASLTLMLLFPNFIAPLFNKFQPLGNFELKQEIEKLAARVNFPLVKIYEIDGSKRSAHSNAYFYGFWWAKRIVLYDTLLHLKHDKILAILGHELGHWKLGHTLRMMVVQLIVTFAYCYLYGFVMHDKALFYSFGYHDTDAVIIGLLLFSYIFHPVNAVLQLITTGISRIHEFQADAFASNLGLGNSLQEGLIILCKENMLTIDPDRWYSWYHYSHPPILERIAALKKLEDERMCDQKAK